MVKSLKLAASIAALVVGLSASAQAADMANDEQIKTAVSDMTIHGSMVDSKKPYVEFYQADGTIKGDGYSGTWSVKDSSMCYQYGSDDPARCWQVDIHGPIMHWYKDGKIDGAGVAIDGNFNKF